MTKILRISLLAGLALGATALTAEAQAAKTFGVVAGVGIASWTGSDAEGGSFIDPSLGAGSLSKSSLVGFTGGFYANIPVGTSLVFEPELLYAGKGVKYDASLTDPLLGTLSGAVNISMGYIEIPLLLRYNFQASGGPYLLLGPEVAFSISCSGSGSGDFGGSSTDCPSNFENSVTFGGVGGLGFQRQKFGLEVRYDFDFGNALQEIDTGLGMVQPNIKNAAWQILLRYQFK
jgi:hypothetical protein